VVLVCLLILRTIDSGLESRSGQGKSVSLAFAASTLSTALKNKRTYWLARKSG